MNDLAEKVREAGRQLGLEVQINKIPNPRREAEEHYYNPAHTGLLSLGLAPHYLTTQTLADMLTFVSRYGDGINADYTLPRVTWQP